MPTEAEIIADVDAGTLQAEWGNVNYLYQIGPGIIFKYILILPLRFFRYGVWLKSGRAGLLKTCQLRGIICNMKTSG